MRSFWDKTWDRAWDRTWDRPWDKTWDRTRANWDMGQKNNFGTKFFNFLLFGQSLRDYNLSLPARSRSSGAKNEGVMPFFSSGAFQ